MAPSEPVSALSVPAEEATVPDDAEPNSPAGLRDPVGDPAQGRSPDQRHPQQSTAMKNELSLGAVPEYGLT